MADIPHLLPLHLSAIAAAKSCVHLYGSNGKDLLGYDHLKSAILGMQQYMAHAHKVSVPPMVHMWRDDIIALKSPIRCDGDVKKHDPKPLLLIPSLINSSRVFDLRETHSFARWFSDRGYVVYILDWCNIKNENVDIRTLVTEHLFSALSFIVMQHNRPVNIVGYCMGGVLLLLLSLLSPEHVRKLILLATPWDFYADGFSFAQYARQNALLNNMNAHEHQTHMPAIWLSRLFSYIDPLSTIQKFARFSKMDKESDDAKHFIAVENWLNDGVDVPMDSASHCMSYWMQKNALLSNEYFKDHFNISNDKVSFPCLNVFSDADRLVPMASSQKLECFSLVESIENMQLDYGHIGLFASRNAAQKFWEPIHDWMKS